MWLDQVKQDTDLSRSTTENSKMTDENVDNRADPWKKGGEGVFTWAVNLGQKVVSKPHRPSPTQSTKLNRLAHFQTKNELYGLNIYVTYNLDSIIHVLTIFNY